VVKYLDLKGRHPLMNDLEGDPNVESDCEGDLPEVKDEESKTKEEKEGQARAVLITGSFSAYVDSLTLSLTREK